MTTWRPDREGDDTPRPLSSALDGVARRLGLPRPKVLGPLFNRWPELVGDSMSARTRPLSLRAGVLVIGVDDPAWATQVKYLADDLRDRLSEALGEGVIQSVEVRVVRP